MKEKFNNFLNNKVLPVMGKLGNQIHLAALRDAFGLFVPLVMVGAVALVFITFFFGGWGTAQTSLVGWFANAAGDINKTYGNMFDGSVSWGFVSGSTAESFSNFGATFFGWLNAATIGHLSIYVSMFIGYSLAIARGYKNPIIGAGTALMGFLYLTGADAGHFGATGTLTAIVAALFATEVFTFFVRLDKFTIKMPAGVPPAVAKGFASLIPVIFTGFALMALQYLFAIPYFYLVEGNKWVPFITIIIELVQAPFINFAKGGGDLGILIVYVIMCNFLFFFGIHGPNTLNGLFSPIATLLWIDNLSGGTNVFTGGTYNGFIFFGGVGATLPLLALLLIFLKKGSPSRQVAAYAIPSGIFEINEPALFGLPIVFNFALFVPFVFGGILPSLMAAWAIKGGWVNPDIIPAPWTTPPIIYGLITTGFDWRSVILSLLNIAIITAQYFPFVFVIKAQEAKQQASAGSAEKVAA